MIRAIIIDDQQNCVDELKTLLASHCPEVFIEYIALSGKEGIKLLNDKPFDLVFVDVEMPEMNGFEMLEHIKNPKFQVIFTTSFDKYAIKAIRFNAFDYLLKPIQPDELKEAVERVGKSQTPVSDQQINNLKQEPLVPMTKIALTTHEGLEYVKLEDIIYCRADGNYSVVFLQNAKELMVSKAIGKLEEIVDGSGFFRIHHSALVNLAHIKKFVRTDGGYVVMSNGDTVSVARNRKESFLELFSRF